MDKKTKIQTISVGENHKRSITATLFLLDQMLNEFKEFASGREIHSVLYHEENNLTAQQKEDILTEIEKMSQAIKELKDTLRLEEDQENIARIIWGKSSTFWAPLIEMSSRYLKGYGETSPELKTYLDPKVHYLIEHLKNIGRIAGKQLNVEKSSSDKKAIDD
ncbi:MAG: hypothetical protein GXO93_01120 [FCB group bacterium]|nr:hypothetical protein [FCB group bacterium]